MTILDINVDGKDVDVKLFLKHCEQICFDCGAKFGEESIRVKIDDGVILCTVCYQIAKEDYPK